MLLEEKHEQSSKGTIWSSALFYMIAFMMAILSFIPILAMSGSDNLISVYQDAKGMVRGERARMQDAVRLATTCNAKLHDMQQKLSEELKTSTELEKLNGRSLVLVETLLESESKLEMMQGKGMEDHVKLSTIKQTMHARMASLNATYGKALSEAKNKISRVQVDLKAQVTLNEKLENDLHKVRKELAEVQKQQELYVSQRETKETKGEPSVSLSDRSETVMEQISAKGEPSSSGISSQASPIEISDEYAIADETETPMMGQPAQGLMKRTECEEQVAAAQVEMQDDIDKLTQEITKLKRQLVTHQTSSLSAPCKGRVFEYNSNRGGVPIVTQVLNSARRCKELCYSVQRCHAWTYHKTEGKCDVMEDVVEPTTSSCCVSGVKCS